MYNQELDKKLAELLGWEKNLSATFRCRIPYYTPPGFDPTRPLPFFAECHKDFNILFDYLSLEFICEAIVEKMEREK